MHNTNLLTNVCQPKLYDEYRIEIFLSPFTLTKCLTFPIDSDCIFGNNFL